MKKLMRKIGDFFTTFFYFIPFLLECAKTQELIDQENEHYKK